MYVVYVSTPYEGESEVFFGNMEELREWFKSGRGGYSLDDLQIYNTDAPDVYSLAAVVAEEE